MEKNHPEFRANIISKVTEYIKTTENAGDAKKIIKFVTAEFGKNSDAESQQKLATSIEGIIKKVESGEIDWEKYVSDYGHHASKATRF
jgi:hypothetical protein